MKRCLKLDTIKNVRIATGYWDIPGLALITDELSDFLQREGTRFQLLIGKDPNIYAYQVKNPKYKDANYPHDFIRTDINNLEVKEQYKKAIDLLLTYCTEEEDSKVQIRIYKRNENEEIQFLHSKCYIFDGVSEETGEETGYGIIGSSNFTQKGLQDNSELNYLESNYLQVMSPGMYNTSKKSHSSWFNEKWEMSEKWNQVFLEQVLKPTPLAEIVTKEKQALETSLTPYEIYIKYLQSQLGDIANPDAYEILSSYLPKHYQAMTFQLDAVQQCFFIMKQHGGFLLADVVGLGKTIVGLLIIKKFITEASQLHRSPNVLIVTPPAIKKSWESTIQDFDNNTTDKMAPYIDFITTGSIGKLNDLADDELDMINEDYFEDDFSSNDYGLIIIDESHNFRNSNTQKYKALDNLIGNIHLQKGYCPFIGLLSATPMNNTPDDIKNQIYLFQRTPNNSSLPNIEGGKLDTFMSKMQKEFTKYRKEDSTEAREQLKHISNEIRVRVLNDLVVRRTRRDIKKTYASESAHLNFPTVCPPHKLEYKLDSILCRLFADTIDAIVPPGDELLEIDTRKHIGFYRYSAIQFFKSDENTKIYESRNLTVDSISSRLAQITRILLVKRLESSFSAFKKSLHNLQRFTQNMIDMLQSDCVYICPDMDINKEIIKAGTLQKAMPIIDKKMVKYGGNNRKFRTSDFKDEYLSLLQQDMNLISDLCKRWDENDFDPKLDTFKQHLNKTLFDKEINNPNGYDKPRLVIFTEALDTLNTLARHIQNRGHRVLKVSAKNRMQLQKDIIENFDANSDIQKDDYDVIVTTEVLAEGVNLHRANVILNYDTPWNATRLMQRIGRANRIGSKEEMIHVFNFYPSPEGNQEIMLIEIAYAKLQSFHIMFGDDSKVFNELEEISEADFNRLIDGEESPFFEYIKDLKDYQEANPDRFKKLQEVEMKNLGCSTHEHADQSLVVIGAENRGLTNVQINNDEAKVIAPLYAMQFLKCSPMTNGLRLPLSEYHKDMAFTAYHQHITRMKKAKESNKTIKEAMVILKKKIEPFLHSNDAKQISKKVDNALRQNNITVANKLIKFDKEYKYSLFGVDYDFEAWMSDTFGKIAKQSKAKYGQPYIALYENK
ncbi:helicase-related protein [Porphyromonadaceae bacterium W3.11]|nr:helicase-related protein [Porphyromonadaceae bacterium W3.11]